jgi:hypothetical protein
VTEGTPLPFERLDFLYLPSNNPEAEVKHFEDVLGGEVVFAIEAFGTRVAMVRLGEGPDLLLAGHLEGERPVLVFRVPDLERAMADLESRGWRREPVFGIPHGPICSFETPGGHRLAIYELTRPHAADRFQGRRDF